MLPEKIPFKNAILVVSSSLFARVLNRQRSPSRLNSTKNRRPTTSRSAREIDDESRLDCKEMWAPD